MSGVIRTGIVGFGRMGQIRLDAMRASPKIQPLAVCDVDEGMRETERSLYFTRDYRDLLRMDLDAIFVCTPNRFSPEVVVHALEAGRHVFCEKPPGRDLEDIAKIIEAEKRHPGLVLKYGFNHRYHMAVKEAKSIIDSGRFGQILWARGVYGKSGGVGFEESWRSKREIAGGGILLDQGIHMLDLFRYFCGEFDEIKSYVTRSFWKNTDVEDNAFALLRNTQNNRIAMLHSSSTHWKHTFLLDICLTDGYIAISGILSGTRSYGRETLVVGRRQFEDQSFAVGNPREEIIYFDSDPSWQDEVDEFADSVLNGRKVVCGSCLDALKALELVYKIYGADEGGRK